MRHLCSVNLFEVKTVAENVPVYWDSPTLRPIRSLRIGLVCSVLHDIEDTLNWETCDDPVRVALLQSNDPARDMRKQLQATVVQMIAYA